MVASLACIFVTSCVLPDAILRLVGDVTTLLDCKLAQLTIVLLMLMLWAADACTYVATYQYRTVEGTWQCTLAQPFNAHL